MVTDPPPSSSGRPPATVRCGAVARRRRRRRPGVPLSLSSSLFLLLLSAAALRLPPHHHHPCHASSASSASSSRPSYADPEFDCAMRRLALKFASSSVSEELWDRTAAKVFDALELEGLCGDARPPSEAEDHEAEGQVLFGNQGETSVLRRALSNEPDPEAAKEDGVASPDEDAAVYVDAALGSDSDGLGTPTSPLRTIRRAVLVSRAQDGVRTIYLRSNAAHYLEETILLTDEDSGLTIRGGFPGDDDAVRPVVSGAVPLVGLVWKRAEGMDANIFVADVPPSLGLDDVPGVHTPNGRLVVARYPNTDDPFTMTEPNGDHRIPQDAGAKWLPPKQYAESDYAYVTVPSPSRDDAADGWFAHYTAGVGGACEIYDPPVSYWCSNATQGGGAFQFRVPSGVALDEAYLPNLPSYTEWGSSQAVINAWRPARWANWMFEGDIDLSKKEMSFTRGGFQGARGSDQGGDWYIENVLQELDHPGEYYYCRKGRKLFVYLNTTGGMNHPEDMGLLTVPRLEGVFNVTGRAADRLASDITLSDLIITGTRHTYLTAPHAPPSGGDWSLERRGAVFLESTARCTVERTLIDRVDGHGIMISGKNRNTTVRDNEIRFAGGSAVASWGRTDGELDASGFTALKGLYPDGNTITGNVLHEVGHFEKQNSFYVQAKTARSTVARNVMFNGPRAGVNFNDGFTGGDVLSSNLIFNACRESGDHGPFNAWDRQPYLTPIPGSPNNGVGMNWRQIRGNFMIANYQSQDAIDTDDGSQYYNATSNFLVYGETGLKGDFGGHDVRHVGNLYAYVGMCANDGTLQLPGHEHYFRDNRCVVRDGGDYVRFAEGRAWPKMGGNEVYAKGEAAGEKKPRMTINGVPVREFQEEHPGVDDGTAVDDLPGAKDIVAWAEEMLLKGLETLSIGES